MSCVHAADGRGGAEWAIRARADDAGGADGGAFAAFAFGKRWYPSENVRALAVPKTTEQRQAERQTLLRIAGVFGAIAIFWLIYDQNADTWIYFAQSHTDLQLFGGVNMSANQMQALNPVFIVAADAGVQLHLESGEEASRRARGAGHHARCSSATASSW